MEGDHLVWDMTGSLPAKMFCGGKREPAAPHGWTYCADDLTTKWYFMLEETKPGEFIARISYSDNAWWEAYEWSTQQPGVDPESPVGRVLAVIKAKAIPEVILARIRSKATKPAVKTWDGEHRHWKYRWEYQDCGWRLIFNDGSSFNQDTIGDALPGSAALEVWNRDLHKLPLVNSGNGDVPRAKRSVTIRWPRRGYEETVSYDECLDDPSPFEIDGEKGAAARIFGLT